MKKINFNKVRLFLGSLIICLAFSVPAWSLTLTEVGGEDVLWAQTDLSPSGEQDEIDWVEAVTGLEDLSFYKNENMTGMWTETDNTDDGDVWYYSLSTPPPLYFLVKTGNGASTFSHNLYKNIAALSSNGLLYAVLDLEDLGIDPRNITAISHVSEFSGTTPVPEPATMVLFGLGLISIAGLGRKTKK